MHQSYLGPSSLIWCTAAVAVSPVTQQIGTCRSLTEGDSMVKLASASRRRRQTSSTTWKKRERCHSVLRWRVWYCVCLRRETSPATGRDSEIIAACRRSW
jgi:hypothetical protein